MFSHMADIDAPIWPQRWFVVGGFSVCAFGTGALAALLPLVDLRFHNMWPAALCASVAVLPLSNSFVAASRRHSHWTVAKLSLLVLGFGYLVFAVGLSLGVALASSSGDDSVYGSWPFAAYVGLLMPVVTWKAYLPSTLVSGLMIALLVRRLWPLTSAERDALRIRKSLGLYR